MDSLEEKYENDTAAMNRELKDGEKKLTQKSKDYNELKKDIEKKYA